MAELKQPLSKKDVINFRLLYVEACSLLMTSRNLVFLIWSFVKLWSLNPQSKQDKQNF